MLQVRTLSSLQADLDPVPPESGAIVPVAPSARDVELLDAVSAAASKAATDVVMKGLLSYAAITVTSMATRKLGFGFLSGVLLVSGVSFVASQALKR
jgi:hypothetical protein